MPPNPSIPKRKPKRHARPGLFTPHPSVLTPLEPERRNIAGVDLSGDWSYLSEGYYRILEAELAGDGVLPTPADALDAYVVPIAVDKAARGDLAVPECRLVMDRLEPPVLAYPVNPFSDRMELVLPEDDAKAKLASLTRNGTYATLCQRLPADYRIDVVRVLLGKTLLEEYAAFAERVFGVFALPLMRVRVVVTSEAYFFSAVEPLPFGTLTEEEEGLLERLGSWCA